MKKSPIATEVVEFLKSYPLTGAQLAEAAGVNPVLISRLRTGKRADVLSANADAIRSAINALRSSATPTESPATSPHEIIPDGVPALHVQVTAAAATE